jgi:hypothetical protein
MASGCSVLLRVSRVVKSVVLLRVVNFLGFPVIHRRHQWSYSDLSSVSTIDELIRIQLHFSTSVRSAADGGARRPLLRMLLNND